MKIVYCLNSIRGLGGIQRVTIVKANALAEIQDNEIFLVVTDNHKNHPLINSLSEKVHLIHLPINYYNDDYKTDLYSRIHQKILFLKHFFLLQKMVNQIKPDILISVGQSEKWFLPLLRTNASKIREIHFNSNYRNYSVSSVAKRKFLTWLDFGVNCRGYDRVILLTKEDKEKNFASRRKFIYIYNPFTIENFESKNNERKPIILAVGRLAEVKNFSSLIRAWAKLGNSTGGWKLRIVGEGPERSKLESLVEKLNIHNIEMPGYSDTIPIEMAQASFYVVTSKTEGFMLTMLEALACGLPCVSYIFPYGPLDLITDGEDGFLIPFNNEIKLGECMLKLMNNPILLEKMQENALKKSENFSLFKIIQQWMDLFVDLREHKK